MEQPQVYRVVDTYDVVTYAIVSSKTEAQNLAALLTEFLAPAKVVQHLVYSSAAEFIQFSESNYGKRMRRMVPKDRYRKIVDPLDVNGGFGEPAGQGWR